MSQWTISCQKSGLLAVFQKISAKLYHYLQKSTLEVNEHLVQT